MSDALKRATEQVMALEGRDFEQFLDWLSQYDHGHADAWDAAIERDTKPGGALDKLVQDARLEAASGQARPLDEVLGDQ